MRQIYPDLWQTSQEKMFTTLTVHGYLLTRPEGNVLFYNPCGTKDFDLISQLGKPEYQYLSHHHEINNHLPAFKQEFGSKLCCHVNARPYFDDAFSADVFFGTLDAEFHSSDIEVIYTPGHTSNNVCYRYRSPYGKIYLFTGDTIYQDHGEWNTLIMPDEGGNKEDLEESLLRLRDLDVDVVICSVSIGETVITEVTKLEWQATIDGLVARL